MIKFKNGSKLYLKETKKLKDYWSVVKFEIKGEFKLVSQYGDSYPDLMGLIIELGNITKELQEAIYKANSKRKKEGKSLYKERELCA